MSGSLSYLALDFAVCPQLAVAFGLGPVLARRRCKALTPESKGFVPNPAAEPRSNVLVSAVFSLGEAEGAGNGKSKRLRPELLAAFWAFFAVFTGQQAFAQTPAAKLPLEKNWQIQCSYDVAESGDRISTTTYRPQNWHDTTVPATVFAALVRSGIFPEPGYGMNLRVVRGYPRDTSFTRERGEDPLRPTQTWVEHWLFHAPNHKERESMPNDSPFHASWWYRTQFTLPTEFDGKKLQLHFDGINYRADIWLNGKLVVGKDKTAGAFRAYAFDVGDLLRAGGENVLAVEVFPPQADDLAINWVDVSPTPPDDNMGLWHPVYLTAGGPVAIGNLQVRSHLDLPSLEMAHITIFADLHNYEDKPVDGVLSGSIDGVAFHRTVELQPDETKRVTFTPEEYRQLNLQHPRLWWPWQMGAQNLYRAEVRFTANGAVSDKTETSFGIREITSELTPEGYRLFKVNGRRILVRGAGWWSDMLLRTSKENQEAQMRYARAMNLNTIRMDGKFEDENFLVLADKYGMLLMPGWACCDHWEKWQDWTPENYLVAGESLRSVARRFANHPAVLAWLNGDDNPPPERVARMYIDVLEQEAWPDPVIASATGKLAAVTGETGVKMPGPYDYVPPSYWLRDKKLGGAFGFNTETSIGGAVPPLASLKEFIPEDHLWPLGEYWNFHAGGGKAFVNDLQATTDAMRATYGVATSAADYAMKSQVINYDGQRAMFEGYSRNKYHATGVLHEMLNQSWPSVIWQMYDTSLRPGGSFFGARLGCEPLHVQYSYDDRSIIVVNSLYKPFQKLKVTAKVYSFDLTEKFSKSAVIGVAADSSNRVFTLPEIKGLSTTYFVRLTLERAGHGVVSLNFYWLSTKPDEYQWDKSTWFYTPTTSTADMTMLSSLPKVKLTAKQQFTVVGKDGHTTVEIENKTSHLAFFVHLTLSDKDGREVLPVFWDDNYFELMPGEKRISIATYSATTLGGTKPVVSVDGWNVEQAQATIAAH